MAIALKKLKLKFRRYLLVLLSLVFFWLSASPAGALSEIAPNLQNPQELETFFDGVFAATLEQQQIPGATVSVVKDGQLLFAKGYGYADLERRIPVVAERTLFRIGSISKLFTWTAVMQLVEQGKLDLDADVNTYLADFQIPATYPQPITLTHLMTHTPGFENWAIGLIVHSEEELKPLSQVLAEKIPARVRPPGELSAYSNYGVALAGYIVERISGMPFEQYVRENIFQPLAMDNSTFNQPPLEPLAAEMATGYVQTNNLPLPKEFEYITLFPAGSMSATATDMAKFAIAHLQNGRYQDTRILQPDTARVMHQQQFTHDPRVSGWTYGFMEAQLNNLRLIYHTGGTNQFFSILALLPQQNVGLFISYNQGGKLPVFYQLLQTFLDRYYPAPQAPVPEVNTQTQLNRFTGSYLPTRTNYTSIEKLNQLFSQAQISSTTDGLLLLQDSWGTRQWQKVEPLVFRHVSTINGLSDLMVFEESETGEITQMYLENSPAVAWLKLPWYQTAAFHFLLLGACILVFLSALGIWLLSFFVLQSHPASLRSALWIAGVSSTLNLIFLLLVAIALSQPTTAFSYGIPNFFKIVLVIPLLNIALTIAAVFFAFHLWHKGSGRFAERLHYSTVTIFLLAFLWFLDYWNLLQSPVSIT